MDCGFAEFVQSRGDFHQVMGDHGMDQRMGLLVTADITGNRPDTHVTVEAEEREQNEEHRALKNRRFEDWM